MFNSDANGIKLVLIYIIIMHLLLHIIIIKAINNKIKNFTKILHHYNFDKTGIYLFL